MTEDAMDGKICVITGANTGIGKETAIRIAEKGAHVVMACRSEDKGNTALKEVMELSGSDKVEFMRLDLASLESVREFAKAYKDKHQKLHVLINNAGVVPWKRELTGDGLELTFQVNFLGPFQLTNLLLDVIKTSAPARIVNLTSGLHKMASINFDDLQSEKKFGGFHAYNEAKLGVVLFTYELARRLEGTGVTANTVHPGVIKSELSRHAPWYMMLGPLFFKPVKKGAITPVFAASSKSLEQVTGKYLVNKTEAQSSNESYDEAVAKRLFDVASQLSGL